MPQATTPIAAIAESARMTFRLVGVTPRVEEQASGSTESMTSTPRTTTAAKDGRSSGPNVPSAYQATATPPKIKLRAVGGMWARCRTAGIDVLDMVAPP